MNISIRSIKFDTRDGKLDIRYDGAKDVLGLASYDEPSSDFKRAVIDLESTIDSVLGIEPERMKAIAVKHDMLDHAFKFSFESLGADGHSVCKVVSPKYEYSENDKGELLPQDGASPALIEAVRRVEECAARYIEGERSQQLLQFMDGGEPSQN